MIRIGFHAAALALVLAGCANLSNTAGSVDRGIDGATCVGRVAGAVDGLAEAGNPALMSKAQMPTGQGGVCAAKVFAATAPVVLYRVFDGSKPYTKLGGWWSLKRPSGSRDEYRAAYAICPEWSALDRLVACEIRPGSLVVLGTTQSARCADGSQYAQTAEIQVFVPNDGRAGITHVGHCTDEESWP